ncbi:MAG: 16S rRNA (guanine(527)-N(7))-methyltransferase RsmG [Gammaproteobacteria bacterium]|nr:16S rRNA (guanine(527)-N(7))-methyltransferase RsmG [Gammaproteobacteria bacterium]MDH5800236.1 16S rRNA (guanine(527)-N(7))-methyltransferase RsmG [Gammaproteobacteria bacterium]
MESLLTQSLRQQGLELGPQAIQKIVAYLQLLQKWNRVYNLTAVREITDMVPLHIMDALSALPFLRGHRILDVGSGAGLPGIPLAIAAPERSFKLLDSNAKKTRFLQQVKMELALENVSVETQRAENYAIDEKFDTVISRAFASISNMLQFTEHLCGQSGIFLAMKGEYPQDELQLEARFQVEEVHKVNVAGLGAQRHIVCIRANPNVALSL